MGDLGTYLFYRGGMYSVIGITVSLPTLQKRVIFIAHQSIGHYPAGTIYDMEYDEFFRNAEYGEKEVLQFKKIDDKISFPLEEISGEIDIKHFTGGKQNGD